MCAPRMFSHPTTHPTMGRCLGGQSWADAVYLYSSDKHPSWYADCEDSQATTGRESADDFGYARALGAYQGEKRRGWAEDAPRVKHMQAPKIQHHVTVEGPPRSSGVLNVVAMLEQSPMILNAKLICRSGLSAKTSPRGKSGRTVARLENSRLNEGT